MFSEKSKGFIKKKMIAVALLVVKFERKSALKKMQTNNLLNICSM